MGEGEKLASVNLVLRSSVMCYIVETCDTLIKFVLVVLLLRPRLGVEGYFYTRSHPLSVGLPWTSYRPIAEASTRPTHNINRRRTSMPPVGLEPSNPAR